jgi:2-polyprenyl-3-methyl-5-hydroxy-6-metoxy-1,4-benzoquinol methylase
MIDQPPTTRWMLERTVAERRSYTRRFEKLAAQGEDVDGEARFVDALAARESVILDAGCGTGRLADSLCRRGHRAVGVDADPLLVDAGQSARPDLLLATLDLTALSAQTLAAAGLPTSYDVIVAAGNVMVYLAPGTEHQVLASLSRVLRPGGRTIFGFLTGRDYTHDHLDESAMELGWTKEFRFGTWQCDPWTRTSDWATSVYRSARGR